MKPLDRWLQAWRIARARRFLPPDARVLDVGCGDGALFTRLASQGITGVGLDPRLATPRELSNAKLLPGSFPEAGFDHERLRGGEEGAVATRKAAGSIERDDRDCAGPEAGAPGAPFCSGAGVEFGGFDVVTCLAVLEHIPLEQLPAFVAACAKAVKPGGRVVLTVPAPRVDAILCVLLALRLAEGQSVAEHHGFDPAATIPLFTGAGLRLLRHERFQFGLNNLFVFERPA